MIPLIDPKTKKKLIYKDNAWVDEDDDSIVFPKINNIFRFVNSSNYTDNFGFQWKNFKKTQLDKFSGLNISKNRFFDITRWDNEDLSDKKILEVGCGAGRFTQIILDYTQADLYSLDYSEAVDANYENNGPNQRLKLFQSSVYEMPFPENTFDKVFCFGVIQHTPDIKRTIDCLFKVLKPEGELIIDFYPLKGFWTKIHSKYFFRPILKSHSNQKLLTRINQNINWMISYSEFFNKIGIGKFINRFIPICDISLLPQNLSKKEKREWAILDTFDMFSPEYDQPQKISTIKKYFIDLSIKNVFAGYIPYHNNLYKAAVVKGTK